MQLNKDGVNLIKSFEGLRTKAYQDTGGVWTIGYGHTAGAGNPIPKAGMVITEKQAEDMLVQDLKKYIAWTRELVKVDLNDNQFSALVSFCYNLGPDIDSDTKAEGLGDSTLLKKVNAKDFSGAAKEFAKWDKDNGKVLAGLTRRRAAEAALFQKPVIGSSKPVQPLPDDPGIEGTSKPKRSVWAILGDLIMKLIRGKK